MLVFTSLEANRSDEGAYFRFQIGCIAHPRVASIVAAIFARLF